MDQQNTALIIFGITGDLSLGKIVPALSNLHQRAFLPQKLKIVGIGRRDLNDEELAKIKSISRNFVYIQSDLNKSETYQKIKEETQTATNKLFYLATFPSLYSTIITQLGKSQLTVSSPGWHRILIEKPIGHDIASAQQLDQLLKSIFAEEDIYRVDHYLGKETVQNILTFRFYNPIFETIFNNQMIENIQVTAFEDQGILNRGRYYDVTGALRDVGQNHLLQILALATMDIPKELNCESIRRARLTLLEQIKIDPQSVVFGQYEGYRQEKDVDPNSNTDTFFALKGEIQNPKFSGVPIFIRAGKKMPQKVTEIAIVFKNTKHQSPNVLIHRIQPNEGVVVQILTKKVGQKDIEENYMQFCYKYNAEYIPDAYETLLLEAFRGDQTFFPSEQEIEAQWKIIDPLIANKKEVISYTPGTFGPPTPYPFLEPSPVVCQI